MQTLFTALLALVCTTAATVSSAGDIRIAMMYSFQEWPELVEWAYNGSMVAINEINNDPSWFGGTSLTITKFDTGNFNHGQTLNATFTAVGEGYSAFIGERFSDWSKDVAYSLSTTGIFECSVYSTSPSLSDKGEFPTFFRLVADDNIQAVTMLQFANTQGWSNVGILASTGSTYAQGLLEKVKSAAPAYGVNVLGFQNYDLTDTPATLTRCELIKDAGARIIILLVDTEVELVQMLRLLQQSQMIGPEYAYIGGDVMTGLFTAEGVQLSDLYLAQGLFVTEPLYKNPQYSQPFLAKYNQIYGGTAEPWSDTVVHYDAVYSFAHAFRRIMDVYNLSPAQIADNTWLRLALNVTQFLDFNFTGANGPISWLPNGDVATSNFQVLQPVVTDTIELSNNNFELIAYIIDDAWEMVAPPVFFGGSNTPPADLPILDDDLIGYSKPPAAAIIAITSVLTLVTAASVPLLVIYREHPVLKPMSPMFMALSVLGLLMCLMSIYIDAIRIPNRVSCNAYMCVLAVGFGTVVACILVRLHRLYRIFDNRAMHRKAVSNQMLFGYAGVIVAGEIILMLIWAGRFPLLANYHADIAGGRKYYECATQDSLAAKAMLGAMFGYNAAIVLVCCWLAYATRNIYSAYNQAKAIGVTIYNILFCSILVVLFTYMGQMTKTLGFVLRSGFVLLCIAISYGALIGRFLHPVLMPSTGTDQERSSLIGGSGVATMTKAAQKTANGPLKGTTLPVRGRSPVTTSQWKDHFVCVITQPIHALILTNQADKKVGLTIPLELVANLTVNDEAVVSVTWSQGSCSLQFESDGQAEEWLSALQTVPSAGASGAGSGPGRRASSLKPGATLAPVKAKASLEMAEDV
ncbi:Gamma-aminobutyric acid type B receptor subunit 2 [Geranomyces variabilis]|uniref:Gamma-aminobutyric acid type B receptor subunit 2 n=1 Tax=Geranomyces variabilis TaxID=109894 RepID=A0AAD5TGA7_9FUNG|nr:Gamma-aminobutyric acid type B receptor subunit 2 [Geranomyces variabilis]